MNALGGIRTHATLIKSQVPSLLATGAYTLHDMSIVTDFQSGFHVLVLESLHAKIHLFYAHPHHISGSIAESLFKIFLLCRAAMEWPSPPPFLCPIRHISVIAPGPCAYRLSFVIIIDCPLS